MPQAPLMQLAAQQLGPPQANASASAPNSPATNSNQSSLMQLAQQKIGAPINSINAQQTQINQPTNLTPGQLNGSLTNPLGLANMALKGLGSYLPGAGSSALSNISQNAQDFLYGGNSGYGIAGNIARSIPVGDIGGLLSGVGALAEGAGLGSNILSKAGQFLSPATAASLPGAIGKAALGGGLSTGALTAGQNLFNGNPIGQNVLPNMLIGAATGGGLQGGLGIAGKGLSAFKNYKLNNLTQEADEAQALNLPNSTATPEQAKTNLAAAQQAGIEPTLGMITQNPELNTQFENASNQPFVDQKNYAGVQIGKAQQLGENIVNNLTGGLPSTHVDPALSTALSDELAQREALVETKYDIAGQYTDPTQEATRDDAEQYARNQLNTYNENIANGKVDQINNDPIVLNMLKQFAIPANDPNLRTLQGIGMTSNRPLYNFQALQNDRTRVGNALRAVRLNNPTGSDAQNVLETLYSKLSDDMGTTLQNQQNPEAYNAWLDANNTYRDQVGPFKKGNLLNLMNTGNTQKISDELINNPVHGQDVENKDGSITPSLLSTLNPQIRKLTLASRLLPSANDVNYSTDAQGNKVSQLVFTPSKIGTAMKNLQTGKNSNIDQIMSGLTQNIRGNEVPLHEALQTLHDTSQMVEPLKPIYQAPRTGWVAKSIATKTGPAALGAAVGATLGHIPGAVAGAATGAGYGALKGRMALSYLKNPSVLNAYVNRTKIASGLPAQIPSGVQAFINNLIVRGQQ